MSRIAIIGILLLMWACVPKGREYGKELYETKCANCHGLEGGGLHELYPPLKNSDYLREHQDELVCIIRYGLKTPIVVNGVTYQTSMPSQPMLSDVELANIINYISENFEPELEMVRIEDVEVQSSRCAK